MKIIGPLGPYPPGDQLFHINNWHQFSNDERTKDVCLHIGCEPDFRSIDKSKINIHIHGEWPNSWFNGTRRGMNVNTNVKIEKEFDYIFNFCRQTVESRGLPHVYVPYCYDFDYILSQLDFKNIDDVEKEVDVFMCATLPNRKSRDGDIHPVWDWHQVMKNFNSVFCNNCWPDTNYTWKDKQTLSAKSKISIVFDTFIGSTPACRDFAKAHYPWIKFKTGKGIKKPVLPQAKHRVFDAAFSKSIILCHKSPFAGEAPPYNSPIEDYLDPDTDFIYFEDKQDLQDKIQEILRDYNNEKYKKMTQSAFDKYKNNFSIDVMYEKYIVPIAKKGKNK
mgnify:CR=1 FL=1